MVFEAKTLIKISIKAPFSNLAALEIETYGEYIDGTGTETRERNC
jgi:hypothetical protein